MGLSLVPTKLMLSKRLPSVLWEMPACFYRLDNDCWLWYIHGDAWSWMDENPRALTSGRPSNHGHARTVYASRKRIAVDHWLSAAAVCQIQISRKDMPTLPETHDCTRGQTGLCSSHIVGMLAVAGGRVTLGHSLATAN